ncbi:MAG TPA: ATP-binding protein, partial [Candidatus Sulfotelmatobacter sp.]|nr:ATP-binding protein [Candidatus Sulfotelmatobacter sp.]
VQREGVRSEERPTAELRSQETLNSQRSTRNSFVRLWVEDNGIGIPLEQREKLFGVFQRLHPREPYPGTGIGLAIVKRAVERMGGSVGVESTEGQGSRFWVELRKAES